MSVVHSVASTTSSLQVRVLGCSGAISRGNRTTAFLVGRHLLVDAGTGVGDLTLEEMADIRYVVLTHSTSRPRRGFASHAGRSGFTAHAPLCRCLPWLRPFLLCAAMCSTA